MKNFLYVNVDVVKKVTKSGNRFILGHQNRGRKRPCSLFRREAIIRGHLKRKDPLYDGWDSKTITTNKDCAVYLGNIVEQLLSKIFKDVKVMPHGNRGFDFICSKDLKIDAKGGVISNNKWNFFINRNRIADYFLCIGFNSRKDLIPIHLWLIPGNVINHLKSLKIYKVNLNKWEKYEQSIDKAILCCNEMKRPKSL